MELIKKHKGLFIAGSLGLLLSGVFVCILLYVNNSEIKREQYIESLAIRLANMQMASAKNKKELESTKDFIDKLMVEYSLDVQKYNDGIKAQKELASCIAEAVDSSEIVYCK